VDSSDNGLVIGPPPPPEFPNSVFGRLCELATYPPGTSGRISTHTSAASAAASARTLQMRRGNRKVPPGRWTFVSRKIPDSDKFGVWATYAGPEEPEPAQPADE
jgi:hypothetical protein